MGVERTSGRLSGNARTERRTGTRFRLALPVRYFIRAASVDTGTGETIDLSSSGLKFTGDKPPSTGQRLEVYIDWPALLHGSVKLQLVVWGMVVRTNGPEIAVHIERHEFRTRAGASE